MRIRDYFHSESKMYQHMSPGKRTLRVTELWVGVGFTCIVTAVLALAFLIRAIHDHWFLALVE